VASARSVTYAEYLAHDPNLCSGIQLSAFQQKRRLKFFFPPRGGKTRGGEPPLPQLPRGKPDGEKSSIYYQSPRDTCAGGCSICMTDTGERISTFPTTCRSWGTPLVWSKAGAGAARVLNTNTRYFTTSQRDAERLGRGRACPNRSGGVFLVELPAAKPMEAGLAAGARGIPAGKTSSFWNHALPWHTNTLIDIMPPT